MANPVLVIMAAGMGSRYGGLKQIDPIGPNGQILLDSRTPSAKRRAASCRWTMLIKRSTICRTA